MTTQAKRTMRNHVKELAAILKGIDPEKKPDTHKRIKARLEQAKRDEELTP